MRPCTCSRLTYPCRGMALLAAHPVDDGHFDSGMHDDPPVRDGRNSLGGRYWGP